MHDTVFGQDFCSVPESFSADGQDFSCKALTIDEHMGDPGKSTSLDMTERNLPRASGVGKIAYGPVFALSAVIAAVAMVGFSTVFLFVEMFRPWAWIGAGLFGGILAFISSLILGMRDALAERKVVSGMVRGFQQHSQMSDEEFVKAYRYLDADDVLAVRGRIAAFFSISNECVHPDVRLIADDGAAPFEYALPVFVIRCLAREGSEAYDLRGYQFGDVKTVRDLVGEICRLLAWKS